MDTMVFRMKRIAPLLLLATTALLATAQSSSLTPAQRAFESLKALKGTWTLGTGDKSAKIIYKLTGNGTSIIETQMPDTDMEMVSVYHMDGPNRLMLTHYCAAGNQPTMALLPGATAKEFRFDFVSGTNMKPEDMHIHNVHYRLIDKDHIVTEWGAYSGGKPMEVEKFDLHRQKSS